MTRPTPIGSRASARAAAQMVRIRRFEEKCAELYSAGKIRGFLHLYIGEEAIAAGVMPALERRRRGRLDVPRARSRARARRAARARSWRRCSARREGCSRGRGGSMHLFDVSRRFYGGNAIVAGGLPLAVGLALADKMQQRTRVTACFFGDGAVAEGEFHESMNLAALWKLPVLFLCENNLYAMGTALERAPVPDRTSRARPQSYRDGGRARRRHGRRSPSRRPRAAASSTCATGGGPCFLEFVTYRFRAHSMFDPELYRVKDEVERLEAARSDRALRGARGRARRCSATSDVDGRRARGRRASSTRPSRSPRRERSSRSRT